MGYLSIRVIHDVRALITGSPGIGLGDAKLFAALGAWYGWRALPVIVVAGAVVSLIFYFKRTDKPFGVGLATASIGIILKMILVVLAELVVLVGEAGKKDIDRERRNQETRRMMGRDPYRPSPYDE